MEVLHDNYMRLCLTLARAALAAGNPPVGALIVFEEKVIGKGIESGRSTGDITNHAEILAIRDAVNNGYSGKLSEASMYTTHEPCIMCSYLIRHHKIPKIIYGISVPQVGGFTSPFSLLSTTAVPKWGDVPKVIADVCVAACTELNEAFLRTLNKS